MAICGIAVNDGQPALNAASVRVMTETMALNRDWAAEHCAGSEAMFGVVSPCRTTSLWCSDQVAVACDADLLNGDELRSEVTLGTGSNTAALIAAVYSSHGSDFLNRLRGSFSVAVWDKRHRQLLLAVDRFAVRPLYYATVDSLLVFASQPRGIFASRLLEREVDREAIANFLNFTVVPAPRSAFAGIRKLSPGTFLSWSGRRERASAYWRLEYPEDARGDTDALARRLLEKMDEAVQVNCAKVDVADLGCFLSGGTDSSSVVGLSTKTKRSAVKTFSIGFAEGRYNELNYARIAAHHFGAEHTERVLDPQETLQTIDKMVDIYDEPFANSSAIPTYHCQKLAREHGVRTLLAGDGGDELFGGNERYRTHELFEIYQKVPRFVRRGLFEPLLFGLPLSGKYLEKARGYVRRSNTSNPDRYFQWDLLQVYGAGTVLDPTMPLASGGDPLAVPRNHYWNAPAHSELNRLLYIDILMTLGDNDLPKVSRTSELAGINVRFPLLDHHLAEFSGQLPAHLKVHGLEKRYLFKHATRNLLPEAILKKKKHGFGLPIGLWLKQHAGMRGLAQDVLLSPRAYQRGYFRRDFVEKLFALMDADDTPFYGDLLWEFLMLEMWHRRHVEAAA